MPANPNSVNCVLLGFTNAAAAAQAYRDCYPGQKPGRVVSLTAAEFRQWLAEGDLRKPVEAKWRKGPFRYEREEDAEQYAATPPSGLVPGHLEQHGGERDIPQMKPSPSKAGWGSWTHLHPVAQHIIHTVPNSWRYADRLHKATLPLAPEHPLSQWLAERHAAGDLPRTQGDALGLSRLAQDVARLSPLHALVEPGTSLREALLKHANLQTDRWKRVGGAWGRTTTGRYVPEETKRGDWKWKRDQEASAWEAPSATIESRRYGGSPQGQYLTDEEKKRAGLTGHFPAWHHDLTREANYYPYLVDAMRDIAFPGWNPEFGRPPQWDQVSREQAAELRNLYHRHRAETAKVKQIPVKDRQAFLSKIYPKEIGQKGLDSLPLSIPRDHPLVQVPPRPGDHVHFVDQQTGAPILLGQFAPGQSEEARRYPGTPLGHDQDQTHYHFRIDLKHGQDPREVTANHYQRDQIPGGLADDLGDDDFDPEQLDEGERVEREHTDDPALAREIARDHLREDPDYYRKLARMVEGRTHYAKPPGSLPPDPMLPAELRRKGAAAPRTPAAIAPKGEGVLHPGLTKAAGVDVPGASFPQPPGLRGLTPPALPKAPAGPARLPTSPLSAPPAPPPLRRQLEQADPVQAGQMLAAHPWQHVTPEEKADVVKHLVGIDKDRFWKTAAAAIQAFKEKPASAEAGWLLRDAMRQRSAQKQLSGATMTPQDRGRGRIVDVDPYDRKTRRDVEELLGDLPQIRGVQGGYLPPEGLELKDVLGQDSPAKVRPLTEQESEYAQEQPWAYKSSDSPGVVARIEQPKIQGTGKRGVVTVNDVARYLQSEMDRRYGRPLDWNDPRDFKMAADAAVDEVRFQLDQPVTGEGWYEKDVADAFNMASRIIPEFAGAAGESMRVLGSAIAAPQSGKTRPPLNFQNMIIAVEHFLKTGVVPGRHPHTGNHWNVYGRNTEKALGVIQHLVETLGVDGFAEWWLTRHPVKELNRIQMASGHYAGGTVNRPADEMIFGAYIAGPKYGPFSLGINGIEDTATDMWYSRNFYRNFGQLFLQPSEETGTTDAPVTEQHRRVMKEWNQEIAHRSGKGEQAVQAIRWFFEQKLYYHLGSQSSRSEGFSDGARIALAQRGLTP